MFPGSRDYYGFFDYLGSSAYFWASTEVDAVIAIYLTMDGSSGSISFNNDYKVGGFSVRCVED